MEWTSNQRVSKSAIKSNVIKVINCELGKDGAGCLTNFCAAVAACAFADLSALLDANGNELLVLDTVAAATNFVTLANAATGDNPVFTAGGSDTNVGLNFKTKGTGVFNFLATASGPTDIRWFEDADNGTNYVSLIAPASLAGNQVLTLPDATDTLVGKATTDTLTNKRVTPRATTVADATAGTLTPTGDASDFYIATGLTAATTIAAPTGTPTTGQRLILRLKDNGTGRALTWNAIYRAVGVTLPTTTVANKTHYITFIYNGTDTKWDATSVLQEA